MSASSWINIYRSYEADELTSEITRLKSEASEYSTQGHGDKNYAKDLRVLEDKLTAATTVKNERAAKARGQGSTGLGNPMQVDFSRGG